MRSKILFIKRLIAIFIIISMNVSSFAAVGANDGSAFVTKAEFDALVNTFNEQMDNYEDSIVSKVDGAIANYLASQSKESTYNLPNYYKSITDNYTLYWTALDSYMTTEEKPTPQLDIDFEQVSRSWQFSGKITPDDEKNDTLLYGEFDEGETNFIAKEYKKINPLLTGYVRYFYGFFTSGTSTTYKSPANGVDEMYLNNPVGVSFNSYSPGVTSATSNTSWRFITTVYKYSTDFEDDKKEYTLAPYSLSKTYVYNTSLNDDTQKVTPKERKLAYNSSNPSWTWTDTRVDTSVQTVPESDITKNDETINIIDVSNTKFPWMQVEYVQNEIKYGAIIDVTNEDLPIKYGIKIADVPEDGKATIYIKPTINGYAILYIGDKTTDWPGPADKNIPDGFTVSKLLNANKDATITLDVKEKDKIWFVFYPQDTTATNGEVEISKISLSVEDD